jgi:hypothetical protein
MVRGNRRARDAIYENTRQIAIVGYETGYVLAIEYFGDGLFGCGWKY